MIANAYTNTPHKTSVTEREVGGQKFRVVSHFSCVKSIGEALEQIAISRAMYEENYCN
jgi:hypothetical protein